MLILFFWNNSDGGHGRVDKAQVCELENRIKPALFKQLTIFFVLLHREILLLYGTANDVTRLAADIVLYLSKFDISYITNVSVTKNVKIVMNER